MLPSVADGWESDFVLTSLDEVVAAAQEAFVDELDPSHGGVVVSVPRATGKDEGDWDFADMLSGSFSEREHCCWDCQTTEAWSVLREGWPPVCRVGCVAPCGLQHT